MRVPGLQKGGAPWRGEWGVVRAGREEAVTVAEAICPRINSLLFPVSPLAWDLGQGPVRCEGTGWAG